MGMILHNMSASALFGLQGTLLPIMFSTRQHQISCGFKESLTVREAVLSSQLLALC
jgi:hypothetical protein